MSARRGIQLRNNATGALAGWSEPIGWLATGIVVYAMASIASTAGAETLELKHGGRIELASFTCHDFSRSRIVHRVCYDSGRHTMLLSLGSNYVRYCNVDETTVYGLEAAPSMGQFLFQHIMPQASGSHFRCPAVEISPQIAAKP